MFTKTLKFVDNNTLIKELKIMIILNKKHLFLPDDRFLLFGSSDISTDFSVPKKSLVFLDDTLIGVTGASGSLNIKSDRFTGVLHAVYLN